MLLTRLYLRNFRVYEDELDLALPPGLVGIYGPNGAGKSTLLEAVTFVLWGRARTGRDGVRTTGVGADCITELELEHEGHLYSVRRRLTGVNATMRAEVLCDGLVMAEGATDTRRYVQSILGMDDTAFRASVFAEQKQLAAFSAQPPAERRKLVLQLLGITALDAARDSVRQDAREVAADLGRLRGALPDLAALTLAAEDAEAAAAAARVAADAEAGAASAAEQRAAAARAAWDAADRLRQRWDTLVAEGRGLRAALDTEAAGVERLAAELGGLDAAASALADARAAAAGLDGARSRIPLLRALLEARSALDAIPDSGEPPDPPDPLPVEAARRAAAEAAAAAASTGGELAAARVDLARAEREVEASSSVTGAAACPVCGQHLGDAFATVREHREQELAEASRRVEALTARQADAAATASALDASAARALAQLDAGRRELALWEQAAAARRVTAARVGEASAALDPLDADLSGAPDASAVAARLGTVERAAAAAAAAADEAARLAGRLERRDALQGELTAARDRSQRAADAVTAKRSELHALGFDPEELERRSAARDGADEIARRAREAAQAAEVAAATAASHSDGEAKRLAEGQRQHQTLADLEDRSRHLGRLAVLMGEFRNTVVASVGPRLAAQAAELFGELTDREYDRLEVDPETYELQISDGGRVHGLDRFSGSEIDLANLALRVAISEQVRFQSGGAVGLLVLDEVFGPLDEDRKARMLQALEQLRGRFRQILVVTHDPAIKEQLPNALEVVKLPGRRATARPVNA